MTKEKTLIEKVKAKVKKKVQNPGAGQGAGGGKPEFKWTEELESEICEYIATHAHTIKQSCELHPHWPNRDVLYSHIGKVGKFSDMFLDAKRKQVSVYVDDTLDSIRECEPEFVHISKLKIEIDHKRWYAARLCPRLFGDKTQTEVTVINQESSLDFLK
jgi:hypothetical protein